MTFAIINDGTDRDSWLAARATPGRVTATDVAKIMTGGPGTWATLHQEKESGKSTFRGNRYTEHGKRREPVIAAFAQHAFGLTPSTALIGRVEDGTITSAAATPDALSKLSVPDGFEFTRDGEQCFEVEAFGEYKTTKEDWRTWSDVPLAYRWQVAWQFYVTGANTCYFAFEPHIDFVPKYMEPRYFIVERAALKHEIEVAIETVEEWRTTDVERIPESLLPLDALLTERTIAKREEAEAKARAAEAEAEIRALLVDNGKPFKQEFTDASVSWSGKTSTSTRFNQSAFKEADPETYKRFSEKHETQPRLTITARS